MELWKDIKGYEGIYRVSNMGNVWSVRRERCLSPQRHKSGSGVYLVVKLSLNGVVKSYKVHRLVAQAFIPNPDNKPQVNHKNENTLSNYASNLEWVTNKENANWGTRNDRISVKLKGRTYTTKKKHYNSSGSISIKESPSGRVVKTFDRMVDVVKMGYDARLVKNSIRNSVTYCGYYWYR